MINLGVDIPGGLPYQPWLAARVKETRASNSKTDPHVRCLPLTFLRAYGMPHLLKFVHSPRLLVVLNEMNAGYRQVFTDGRPYLMCGSSIASLAVRSLTMGISYG